MRLGSLFLVGFLGIILTVSSTNAQLDARVTSWLVNTTGQKGHSPSPLINSYVSQIESDVRKVYYTPTSVYLTTSDVPSHDVGPFGNNPAYPADQNNTWRISRNPTPASTHANTPMGPIGVMLNGTQFFNARDAATYNNGGIWHQNANVVEFSTFDAALGHPAPQGGGMPPPGQLLPGAYHYHQHPAGLQNQLHDDGDEHSPLLGFAFDGYPIYGGYGYINGDGTGGIKRLNSSYRLRDITTRHTLADGTALSSTQWGPDVGTQYPLGYYVEDFEFLSGTGDLDQYNGRLTVTPEFPNGTYAYFATIDATGAGAYPYLVGPTYYGTAAQDDLTHSVSIPANATLLPEPSAPLAALLLACLLLIRPLRSSSWHPRDGLRHCLA